MDAATLGVMRYFTVTVASKNNVRLLLPKHSWGVVEKKNIKAGNRSIQNLSQLKSS